MWTHRHLLGIEDLSPSDIVTILDRAERWHELSRQTTKKVTVLEGRTVINLFFEASTRTRTSFEIASQRLGADVVNVNPSISSVTKGETLLDTAKNLEAMHADLFVLRHTSSGAAAFLAKRLEGTHVVNAGDGAHEHPTQALLDAFTMRRHKGRIDGLVVAIVGDIAHSRVARSNAILLGKMGASVRLCGLKTMMPIGAETIGPTCSVVPSLQAAVDGADVVMMLRIQTERFGGAMMSTSREYARTFGLSARILAGAKPDAIVMHPGPINRGVELDTRIADGGRSVILDQVEAGVAVRMAVLDLLLATSSGASSGASA